MNVVFLEGKFLVDEDGKYIFDITEPDESEFLIPVDILSCVNSTQYFELCNHIDESSLPVEQKEFLKLAAGRHLRFDYSKIASYYTVASSEMKHLMEQSGLVCLDFDKALENDFYNRNKRNMEALEFRKGDTCEG